MWIAARNLCGCNMYSNYLIRNRAPSVPTTQAIIDLQTFKSNKYIFLSQKASILCRFVNMPRNETDQSHSWEHCLDAHNIIKFVVLIYSMTILYCSRMQITF